MSGRVSTLASGWKRLLAGEGTLVHTAVGSFALLLGILGASSSAHATPLTYAFEGTVTFATGIWAGQGLNVFGFYTFDSDLPTDGLPGSSVDRFFNTFAGNQGFVWEISVTVGSVTRTTGDNQNDDGFFHHGVQWIDSPDEDQFSFSASRQIGSDDAAVIRIRDLSPSDPDCILPGSSNLTDSPLVQAPDVSLCDTTAGLSSYDSYNNASALEGQLNFTVTSISPPIPEPATALLLGGGLFALALARRHRVRA